MNNKTTVLIVGLGLIGASLGKALKEAGLAHVLGYDAAPLIAERAIELQVIDEAIYDFDELSQVDVIVIAVPVKAIGSVIHKISALIPHVKVLTDVGSVKGEVVRAVRDALGKLPSCFVPGHPIAGSEHSGVEAAQADLFKSHLVILTPVLESDPTAISLITRLWEGCGADVVAMTADRHDEVLAATSHLPHLLAFSLVDTLSRESDNREIFKYAAGGFRDFSRIAASDPVMWHDIFLSNQTATLNILRRFQKDLSVLEQAIEQSDSDTLFKVFTRAKSARDYFTQILAQRNKI